MLAVSVAILIAVKPADFLRKDHPTGACCRYQSAVIAVGRKVELDLDLLGDLATEVQNGIGAAEILLDVDLEVLVQELAHEPEKFD